MKPVNPVSDGQKENPMTDPKTPAVEPRGPLSDEQRTAFAVSLATTNPLVTGADLVKLVLELDTALRAALKERDRLRRLVKAALTATEEAVLRSPIEGPFIARNPDGRVVALSWETPAIKEVLSIIKAEARKNLGRASDWEPKELLDAWAERDEVVQSRAQARLEISRLRDLIDLHERTLKIYEQQRDALRAKLEIAREKLRRITDENHDDDYDLFVPERYNMVMKIARATLAKLEETK